MPEYAKTHLPQSRISKFSGGGPPDPLFKGRRGKGREDGRDGGMGGATEGCGGTMSPSLLGPGGYRGYRGRSNENDLCFYSRQFLFSTVQVTYISAFCLKTER